MDRNNQTCQMLKCSEEHISVGIGDGVSLPRKLPSAQVLFPLHLSPASYAQLSAHRSQAK
jgi:hypothetical protein